MKIRFHACKYLIFDRDRIDPRCKIVALPRGVGAYWERPECLAPDGTRNVQFCSKRGRLRGKVTCLRGMAECKLYEDKEHKIDIKDTEK